MASGYPISVEIREALIDLVIDGIAQRATKGQLNAMIRQALEEYGTVSTQWMQELISEAKAVMRKNSGVDRTEAILTSIAFYESIIRDATVSPRDKMVAQTRIDQLLNLEEANVSNESSTIIVPFTPPADNTQMESRA